MPMVHVIPLLLLPSGADYESRPRRRRRVAGVTQTRPFLGKAASFWPRSARSCLGDPVPTIQHGGKRRATTAGISRLSAEDTKRRTKVIKRTGETGARRCHFADRPRRITILLPCRNATSGPPRIFRRHHRRCQPSDTLQTPGDAPVTIARRPTEQYNAQQRRPTLARDFLNRRSRFLRASVLLANEEQRCDCSGRSFLPIVTCKAMASIINSTATLVNDAYDYYLWTLSLADERTRGWLLVDSPKPTLIYTLLYLLIVWAGPKIMKNRKAFKLTWALVPYNLTMACLNAYIAIQLFVASTRLSYSYVCQPIRQVTRPDEVQIAHAVWWYYFSKLLEFCDTFFFILRKKDNQLSFLHVYHHSTMFSLWWIGIKWVPSGSTFLPAMVNSFIHVLMYSYYGLAALGPTVSKYLWWKKYLTILQLIQFTTALILGINGIRSGCDFPLWMQYALVIYMVSFIVLFGNFYAKAYIAKGKQAYAKRQLVKLKAQVKQEVTHGAMCNGNLTNGHANGYTNGVSKKIQ